MSLTSITVPCLVRDLDAFCQLLDWWETPRMAPVRDGEPSPDIALLVVFNRASEDEMAGFRDVWARHPALHSVFSSFAVHQVGLEGERDLYARDETEAQGRFGNKAGPNFLFFETMRIAQGLGGIPFRTKWIAIRPDPAG